MKAAGRIVCGVICILALALPVLAQSQPPIEHLIPIGGGYSDIYAGFSKEAVANAKNGKVNILVLPMAYSTNAETITDAERATNLRDAEERRFQIEAACKRAAPPDVKCSATLAPIFTRSDAENPAVSKYFPDDLAALFILGGDQTLAMQVISATPLEDALTQAYANGVIVAGTSAGGGMQSAAMLAGYQPNFAAGNSLDFGASDVWHTPEKHGLPFSIKNAILDQHFYQRGRMGRLLNATALPDVPHVGLGVDAYTGVNVYGETRVQDVFGLYTVTILDGQTYHAADAVQYGGTDRTLSLRNVLVQMLAPGNFSYDLEKRVTSIGARAQPPQAKVTRDFKALTLPKGAGPLILAGDLSTALPDSPIIQRFVSLAGGSQAKIQIIAAGYPSVRSAQTAADKYAQALRVPTQTFVVSAQTEPLTIPDDVTGLLLIAKDQSKVNAGGLEPIKAAWQNGLPLLADNGGAAVTGKVFSAHGPTPQDADEAEFAVQKSFLQGTTKMVNGLNLLGMTVEPQLLNDNRWGRLFSLAYNQPDQLAVGLTQNSALEITRDGARLLGDNALVTLDLRNAALELGTNDGFVIANGLLDVFAPDEVVQPVNADLKSAPTRVPTPALSTLAPTSTLTATPGPTVSPTNTPTVTSTIPPTATPTATAIATLIPTAIPFDTSTTNAMLPILPILIGIAVIVFIVLLVASRRQK
jgi:cyanophycinase